MASGARSIYAIHRWGRIQGPDTLETLGFTRDRTPAVSTLHNVFSRLDADAFERVLGEWFSTLSETAQQEAIAIDGKALRGIHGEELPGVKLVSAYSHHRGVVVGQKGGAIDKERESELRIAEALLDSIDMKGRVLTGDALYCQRSLCQRMVNEEGDYLVMVKRNQKSLYEDVELCFEPPAPGMNYRRAETFNVHGDRIERRRLWATDVLKDYLDWPGHAQVLKVESWRTIKGKTTRKVRYAITSLAPGVSADRLLGLVRDHWLIENGLHYVKDVSMGEDASRVRTGSAPQVMAASEKHGAWHTEAAWLQEHR